VPNTHVKDDGKTTPAIEVRRLSLMVRCLVGNMANVDVSACAVLVGSSRHAYSHVLSCAHAAAPNTHLKDDGKTTPAIEVRRLLFSPRSLVREKTRGEYRFSSRMQ